MSEQRALLPHQDVIDQESLQILRELDGGSPDFLRDMVALFIDSTKEKLVEMQESFRELKWKRLGDGAHKLKSSAGSLGAFRFVDICARIEKKVLEADYHGLDVMMIELDAEYRLAEAGLKQAIADDKGSAA